MGIADGHTYFGGLYFFLRAGFLRLFAVNAFAILHLYVMRAFLATRVGQCAICAREQGHHA
jgi:hypothetical protein